MIITLRTDNPQAEVGLFGDDYQKLGYIKWQAHRELSSTILIKMNALLSENGAEFKDIKAVVYYQGPGSFTGLRIGASVANALNVPVASSNGDAWLEDGFTLIKNSKTGTALPNYGAEPHITTPRK